MGKFQPAPGTEQYDYQNAHFYDDVRAENMVGSILPAFIGTILVCTRLYCQIVSARKLYAADWLIVVAWIFAIGVLACTVIPIDLGMGWHQLRVVTTDPHPPNRARTMFITAGYVGPLLWVEALTFIKLSLLFYYRQLFLVHQRALKFIIWILFAYLVGWGVACTFVFIFKCEPISYNWTAKVKIYGMAFTGHGKCQQELLHLAVPTITSTVSDVALLILPAAMLMRLQMSNQRRAALMALFSVGLFTIGVGIARIVFLFEVDNGNDFTWTNVKAVTWSCVEVWAAIICACVPPSAPLFKDALAKAKLRSRTKQTNRTPAYLDDTLAKSSSKPLGSRTESEEHLALYDVAKPGKPHVRSESVELESY